MKQLKYPLIASLSWGIIGGFFYSAWSMIIGTGFLATIIFGLIWFIPLLGLSWWAKKEEEAAARSMRRCLKILSASNNGADQSFIASVNHYNNVARRNHS